MCLPRFVCWVLIPSISECDCVLSRASAGSVSPASRGGGELRGCCPNPFVECTYIPGLVTKPFSPAFPLMLTTPHKQPDMSRCIDGGWGAGPVLPWQPCARRPPLFPQLAGGGSHLVDLHCASRVCGSRRAPGTKQVTLPLRSCPSR